MNGPVIKSGFFLLSGIALFAFVGVTLAKLNLFEKVTPYVVVFNVEDGINGLSEGSAVQIGGLPRGRVVNIVPVIGEQKELKAINANIVMDEDVKVFKDAKVLRILTLLGSTATLNFVALGSEGDPLPAGSQIQAQQSSGVLASLLGPYNATKANEIIDNFVTFSKFLESVPNDYQTKIVPILDNAGTVLGDIRTDYSDWRTKISTALTSAQTSMQKLDSSLTDAQQILVRNGPKIDSTIANLDSSALIAKDALNHFNQETVPLLDSALRHAEASVDSFGKSVEIVHTLLLERSPDIAEMLSNLRTTAAQLKLSSMEIRRSPWKILYQPNSDQIAHENLYESARSFAMAAGDLRSAGDSLRLVIERDPGRYEADVNFREAVQTMVLDALAKYELAQQQLNNVLMSPEPAGESKAK